MAGSVVSVLAACATIAYNGFRFVEAETAAEDLAAHRNTCHIAKMTVTQRLGRVALDVTADVHSERRPQDKNGSFDGIFMETSFADASGEKDGLVLIAERGRKQFSDGTHSEVDGPTNSATFTPEDIAKPGSMVGVYRQNSIVVHGEVGGGIATKASVRTALIPCGVTMKMPGPGIV